MTFTYPLKLNFKLIALAPRISVVDSKDQEIFYIEQKVLALKEAVKVFDNQKDKNLLYTMQANQIIDFGATYTFRDKNGHEIGTIQQEGMRSLFQASYTITDKKGASLYTIKQTNPMIAVLDSLINIIPFAELVSGFILNPTYAVTKNDSQQVIFTMKKKPSFFESNFEVINDEEISDKDELLLILSMLMLVQLERNRG